jgi:hypothetical protein
MYMTATPIPRTLALVEHGDLALYAIDELPPGRSPVATSALKDTPANRALVPPPSGPLPTTPRPLTLAMIMVLTMIVMTPSCMYLRDIV